MEIDNEFEPDENLYRRIRPESLHGFELPGGQVPEQAMLHLVNFPDFSVNREKYCNKPEDVLTHDCTHWGIGAFSVGDVPPKIPHLDNIFEFTSKYSASTPSSPILACLHNTSMRRSPK